MILLKSAKFKNFKSLRDVFFQFSDADEKKLTVIRAANGTGKTTLLNALTWGLFGDEALLGGKRKRLATRLSPSDWDISKNGERISIEVEIDVRVVDDESGIPSDYHIIRKQTEVFSTEDPNTFSVEENQLTVLKESKQGSMAVPDADLFLRKTILPFALKDIFFFDGDGALKFVDKEEISGRRERVESAIRKLLGLEMLEAAQRHLEQANTDILKRIRLENPGTPIEILANQEIAAQEELLVLEEALKIDRENWDAIKDRKIKYEQTRDEILASGGGEKEVLKKNLENTERDIVSNDSTLLRNIANLRDRLNTSALLFLVARQILEKTSEIFAKLEEQKIIPNTLPEIIESTLEKGLCICGADISQGTKGHSHLSMALNEMKQQSSSNTILLSLSQGLKSSLRQTQAGPLNWLTGTKDIQSNIVDARLTHENLHRSLTLLKDKINQIPEADLQTVMKNIEREEKELSSLDRLIGAKHSTKEILIQNLKNIRAERENIESKNIKYKKGIAEQAAAKDLLAVVTKTIQHLKNETLDVVSDKMNNLFLEMIVNVPSDDGAEHLIEGAFLNREYDIQILGPNGTVHIPGTYLSGAQQRALTISFILSLIMVSGESAVTVIDTPLGMTDFALRRSLVTNTIINSKQLILFLTYSEINSIEDILDKYCGQSYTMTNTDHFPGKLANKPESSFKEVIVCSCDHRNFCKICKRKEDS